MHAPISPITTPSTMKGALTNRFVAPVSFMILISSFLTAIPIITVLLIRNIPTARSIAIIPIDAYPISLAKSVIVAT
jgi:hypothetical protein